MKKKNFVAFIILLASVMANAQLLPDNNAVAAFSIGEVHISEEGLMLLGVSYRIAPKVHIYITSPIANDLDLKIGDGKIVKADYPGLIQKEKESYISGSGEFFIYVRGSKPEGSIKITFQGCSDDGVCFIPEKISLDYKAVLSEAITEDLFPPTKKGADELHNKGVSEEGNRDNKPQRSDKKLAGLLKKNINNPIWAILLVFLAGFLTSLTPCVYPMIPVTISYFGKTGEGGSVKGSFIGSLFYVLGLSVTYTLLGLIAGLTGSAFGSFSGNKYVMGTFALLFFLMAFMMCDYLVLPGTSLISGAGKQGKRSFFQPFILGLITGLVASPCVGPVVLFLLTLIISSGNVAYGAMLMFVFSLGLGLIFIIIGTFSGALNRLPKAGMWMEKVKVVFSILMVGVAVYFLRTALLGFIPHGASNIAWGIGIIFALFFLGFFDLDNWKDTKDLSKKKKSMGVFIMLILFLIGSALLIKGVVFSSKTAFAKDTASEKVLHWYTSLEEGMENAAKEDKMIFMDFRADWCAMCREFEEMSEKDPEVIDALSDFVLVKLDYEKHSDLAKNTYNVMGLPTFLILDKNGNTAYRECGFLNITEFKADLISAIKKF